jgi:hypothetical protein
MSSVILGVSLADIQTTCNFMLHLEMPIFLYGKTAFNQDTNGSARLDDLSLVWAVPRLSHSLYQFPGWVPG